jgi:hypothetical protein
MPTHYQNILLIAKILCLTPTKDTGLFRDIVRNRWWIIGCIEGDQILPMTGGCPTIAEAIENFLGWYAVEADKEEEENGATR